MLMRRAQTRTCTWAIGAFGALILSTGISSAETFEAPLSIEGELALRVTQASGLVMVRVEDESGAPVSGARVQVDAGSLQSCDGGPPSQVSGADGSVCFRSDGSLDGIRLRAEKEHFAGTSLSVTLGEDDGAPELVIWPRVIHLERDELHPIEVARVRPGPLSLSLVCGEKERELTHAEVNEATSIRLEVPTSAFQQYPGICELFSSQFALKSPATRVLLRGTVGLKLGGISEQDSTLAIEIDVQGDFGPVQGGAVELIQTGSIVAAAAVQNGRARFELPAERSGQRSTVRFVSADPALVSGAPLELELPRVTPRSSSRAWLALPLVLFLIWLVQRLTGASPRVRPSVPTLKTKPREVSPPVPVHGVVFDIDTHERLAGATVELFRFEATRRELLEATVSAPDGSFSFSRIGSDQTDWEVECSAPGYPPLRLRPAQTALRVGLVAKRRVLLRAFLNWLERANDWSPKRRPVPTPLEAAARARQEGREDVVRWAEALSAHLYGPRSEGEDPDTDLPPEPPPLGALR